MVDKKNRQYNSLFILIGVTLLCFAQINSLQAGPREQARRLHDRLAGVPPTDAVLTQMTTSISGGDFTAAANMAMDNRNFYNVTLKNFITPWTNEDQTVFAALNDYSATVIGMVRDDKDFREILYGDIIYTASGDNAPSLTAYSNSNNQHYIEIEAQGLDLSDSTILKEQVQSDITSLPADATAGIITTRAAAAAFFVDGTNRAMFRFTLLNHLCVDMEQIKDNTRATDRIRQDVSRSPGGDSRIYINACSGCHTGMDPLMQAYAYYDFVNNALEYNTGIDAETGSRVQPKFLQNATVFPNGFITPDDSWDNYWREGPNSVLGWDTSLPDSGAGAKSMGQELASTEAFASCQVKKVFRTVCLSEPTGAQITSMTNKFKGNGYQLKSVFADAAYECRGQ